MAHQLESKKMTDLRAKNDMDNIIAQLELALKSINSNGNEGPPSVRACRKAITNVIGVFITVATEYRDLVLDIVPRAREANPATPINDAYYYHLCLSELGRHSALLVILLRNLDFPENTDVIKQMIDGISSRISELPWIKESHANPQLIPWPMPKFAYVDFRYISGLGIIGIPYEDWLSPNRNLSILWHEVAGYAVAVARQAGLLDKWATELADRLGRQPASPGFPKPLEDYPSSSTKSDGESSDGALWKLYISEFENAFLNENPPVKLSIVRIGKNDAVRVENSREMRYYFDKKTLPPENYELLETAKTDLTWQADRIGEFWEDLYGAQALGTKLLEILIEIFVEKRINGVKSQFGDRSHPSPALRLQTIIEFLSQRIEYDVLPRNYDGSELTDEALKEVIIIQKEQFGGFIQQIEIPDGEPRSDFRRLALTIARYYMEIMRLPCKIKEPWPSLPEKEQNALQIYDRITRSAKLLTDLQGNWREISEISVVGDWWKVEAWWGEFFNSIQSVTDLSRVQSLSANDESPSDINWLELLKSITEIQFTDTDYHEKVPTGEDPLTILT